MKRTLMIGYCSVTRGQAFLVGYVRGDSSTALPDNFACPYRNDPNGLAPLCCKDRTLEKCLKFPFMVEHIKTLKDPYHPTPLHLNQKSNSSYRNNELR